MNLIKFFVTIISFLLISVSHTAFAQLNLTLISALDPSLSETSGLEQAGTNTYWTHNDSGDGPRIYEINASGNIIRTVYIDNAIAQDIEEIAKDDLGNLYVADVGNNNSTRQNLQIYKITPAQLAAGDTVTAEIIYYSYPDQTSFPPPAGQENFDCEALFHHNNQLHLFSKNWGNSNFSRHYTLPDDSGTYIATLVDSFNTQNFVTAADLSPDATQMTLLSVGKLILFNGYLGTDFFGGNSQNLSMPITQKEAVLFITNDSLLITDEVLFTTGGNLYATSVAQYTSIQMNDEQQPEFHLYPNPASDYITIESLDHRTEMLSVKIENANSQIQYKNIIDFSSGTKKQIAISHLPNGVYTLSVLYNQKRFSNRFIISR